MPPVPSVRGERIVRALERAGFEVARMHGSHCIMGHPNGRGTTVPVHRGRDVAKERSAGFSPTLACPSPNFNNSCDAPVQRRQTTMIRNMDGIPALARSAAIPNSAGQ